MDSVGDMPTLSKSATVNSDAVKWKKIVTRSVIRSAKRYVSFPKNHRRSVADGFFVSRRLKMAKLRGQGTPGG